MTIKTIDQLLQNAYRQPDHTTVHVTLMVPLRILRQHHDLFAELQIEAMETDAKLSRSEAALEAAVDTTPPEPTEAAPAPKSPKSKSARAKKPARKPPARGTKKRAPTKVTIEVVRKALAAGHNTPTAIAQELGTSPKVVSTSLSRYVQRGLLVRTSVGQYSLPPESTDATASA